MAEIRNVVYNDNLNIKTDRLVTKQELNDLKLITIDEYYNFLNGNRELYQPKQRATQSPWIGVYEYIGVQRSGKSTEMTKILLDKILDPNLKNPYQPHEIFCNYYIDIKGINCGDNEMVCHYMTTAWLNNWKHIVFVVDEASQLFLARNSKDLSQSELCKTVWQMPKKDTVFLYSSNPGKTVDKMLRDGTWTTIVTRWIKEHPITGQPAISLKIIKNYENKSFKIWSHDVTWIHNFFDSHQPIH